MILLEERILEPAMLGRHLERVPGGGPLDPP